MKPLQEQDTNVENRKVAANLGQSNPKGLGHQSYDLVNRLDVSLQNHGYLEWLVWVLGKAEGLCVVY